MKHRMKMIWTAKIQILMKIRSSHCVSESNTHKSFHYSSFIDFISININSQPGCVQIAECETELKNIELCGFRFMIIIYLFIYLFFHFEVGDFSSARRFQMKTNGARNRLCSSLLACWLPREERKEQHLNTNKSSTSMDLQLLKLINQINVLLWMSSYA